MKQILLTFLALMVAFRVGADIQFKTVEYRQGDAMLEGLSVYDDAVSGKRPGVLVAHQWKGLSAYERKRAEMLARLGYNVFVADVYGKGIRPSNPQEAAAQAGRYKNDRPLLKERIRAAFDQLKGHELTDPSRMAAIGYCFGGTTVLELARSGADLAGVVSFHGGLNTPRPEEARNIRCKVLVLHGSDDPNVPRKEVEAFEDEMRQAKVDWELISYGGAVHSFTDWNAGHDNSKGAAYNEKADQRSWEAMKQFLVELFH
jgi:dienelactone hydrolase